MSVDNQLTPAEPGKRKILILKALFAVFVCLLACGFYFHFYINTAYIEVELTVEKKTDFKIYYAEPGKPYSEKKMAWIIVNPDRKQYSAFLANLGKLERLRIDTHAYEGEATLKRLVIRQEGWAPLVFETAEQFGKLVPLYEIGDSRAGEDGFLVQTTGKDGQFELVLAMERQGLNIPWILIRLAVISAIVLSVLYCAAPLATNLRFVPILLFGVWMLIIVMASTSKENVHPDEYVHTTATAYYQDHWMPPVIEDPAIRNTFSTYGVSRLNSGEIYYLFSGKVHQFFQAFNFPNYLSFRMFNVLLFGLVVLYTIRNRHARMVALPFLVSAQIWYIFSYCASDSFALFFAFLAACELVNPDSLLHRYLKGDSWGVKIFGALGLGLLIGIVFLLKKNYLPFVAFFYLVIIVKVFFTDEFYWEKRAVIVRLLVITCLGLCVYGSRVGLDYYVNGFDRQEKIERLQEEMADHLFKPSTELHKKQLSLYRKARGVTLERAVIVDRWFEKTFRSTFGVFGYFTVSGTSLYYDMVRWSGVILLVFFFAAIFRGGGLVGSGLAISGLGISAALIGTALYHSWTIDFQPQGRYLFPIIPMLGALYALNYTAVHRGLLILCLTPMFLLGVYGFIFEALMRIPQIVFP